MTQGTVDLVTDAISYLQNLIGALTGIEAALDNPPEGTLALPCSICYVSDGTWEISSPGTQKGLLNLRLEIHFARGVLPEAVEQAMAYNQSIPNEILSNPTLGDNVNTVTGPINFRFGNLEWAGEDHIGYEYTVPIKMEIILT
uniref:Tail protein n=1 Tax=viral metagenome TaxID=1070528 RepID=A0A6M3M434_9ZZZZ